MSLIVGVDDYSSESDVIIIPSALDFVSQDEMLTPLGRLDKYAASENVFNRYVHILLFKVEVEGSFFIILISVGKIKLLSLK